MNRLYVYNKLIHEKSDIKQEKQEGERELTISILIEQAEGFFELGDLIISELIGHYL